jgi:hypothetical protein
MDITKRIMTGYCLDCQSEGARQSAHAREQYAEGAFDAVGFWQQLSGDHYFYARRWLGRIEAHVDDQGSAL